MGSSSFVFIVALLAQVRRAGSNIATAASEGAQACPKMHWFAFGCLRCDEGQGRPAQLGWKPQLHSTVCSMEQFVIKRYAEHEQAKTS